MRELRHMSGIRGGSLLLLACCLLAGCAYTCHSYLPFRETVEPERWVVQGDIDRYRPADWKPGPGIWPHWSADADDRYRLELVPVAADTTWWERGEVAIENVVVTAGVRRVRVEWATVVDLVQEAAERPVPLYRHHALKYGKFRFESAFFGIPVPVPDTLHVDYELVLKETDSSAETVRRLLRSCAVVERHRRWHIVDMSES
jgi:hypothetical protein